MAIQVKPGDRVRFKRDNDYYTYKTGDTATVVREVKDGFSSLKMYRLRHDRLGTESQAWEMDEGWFELLPEEKFTEEEIIKAQSLKTHEELGNFLGL